MAPAPDQGAKPRPRYRQVLLNRNVGLLLFADLVSYMGNGLHWITLSWFILQVTHSPFSVGISLVFTSLPNALTSPFAGAVVDRFNRRNVAVAMDITRCALVLLMVPLVLLVQPESLSEGAFPLEIGGIYLLTALVACADAFFAPAVFSLLPEITDKDSLTVANSAINTVIQAGLLLGGALAGYLLIVLSPAVLFTVNALSFLASGVALAAIRYAPMMSAGSSRFSIAHVMQDIGAGVRYLGGHGLCAVLALLFSLNYVVLAIFNVLNPPLSINVLKAGSEGFGLMDAAIGFGALSAGFVVLYLMVHWGESQLLWLGYAGMAAFAALLGITPNLVLALGSAFMLGVANTVSGIVYSSVLQKTAAREYMGRVRSLVGLASTVLSAAIVLLYGYMAEQGWVRETWLFSGLTLAFLAGYALLITRLMRSARSPSLASTPE